MNAFDYLFRPAASNEQNQRDEFRLTARLWGRISDRVAARGGALGLHIDRAEVATVVAILRDIALDDGKPEADIASANPNRAYMAKLRAERSPDRWTWEEAGVVDALAEFIERHPRGLFVDRSPSDPARTNRATYGGSQAEARAEKRSPSMAYANGRMPN